MRKISLSLIALAPMLMAYPYEVHNSNVQTVVTNQTIVNTVIASTTQISEKSAGQPGAQVNAGGQFVYSDKINVINIPFSYSFENDIGLEFAIPVVSNRIADERGLGDISVGANYSFGSNESTTGLNITNIRYKSMTGGDMVDGLGSGADAYSISHTIAKKFNDKVQFYGLANYTINTENDIGIRYGDSYSAMIGESHKCFFTNKLVTNTKIVYFHNDNSKPNGFPENDDSLTTTDFWVELTSPKHSISAGLKIPLTYDAGSATTQNAKEDGKSIMFYLSASSTFF